MNEDILKEKLRIKHEVIRPMFSNDSLGRQKAKFIVRQPWTKCTQCGKACQESPCWDCR